MLTQEELYINEEIEVFVKENTSNVQFLKSLIDTDDMTPDLHYCYYHIDRYKNLLGQLNIQEYRIDFAINAYHFHVNWQKEFKEQGLPSNTVKELANDEIKQLYESYNSTPLNQEEKSYIKATLH